MAQASLLSLDEKEEEDTLKNKTRLCCKEGRRVSKRRIRQK